MILSLVSELLARVGRRPVVEEAVDNLRRSGGFVRLDGLTELAHLGAQLRLDSLVALVRLLVLLDALDLRLDVRHADTSFVGL